MNKIIGLTALIILLQAGGAGAATPISACTKISSPGEYILTQNIINSTINTCIAITSSNVIFDGAGYTIASTYGTYGVYVYNSTNTLMNVTVLNLIVMDWSFGIFYL